ncbi:restriction endonuclease subunit S [Donghicola eburneus]|uniref:restriction endonuclease subunit S n=1 Tax=Donghicola eburneus TaxID=393278 RepID=UPI0008F167A6|nr:restriction endonuclease subunit S [Donghicola eburneus]SFQ77790.1 type I restriction enzyme, S subunit [Donghicola eburneus]
MNIAAQQTHDAYKDSGIDWVGEIPATWDQIANKHLFRLRKTQVGKRSSEYDLLSLTLRGIIKRDMENPEGKFPAEFDTYQEVRPGDFVFCHFDVEETPRTVGLSTHHGMITGAYTVYEPTGEADSGFLYYFYLHADTDKKLRSLYKGLRNTIPKDTFAAFKTPLPPLPEQRAIAAFLDRKCATIDEAVRIKEEQIRLLAERRQILIQQAVTRGLNPAAPMKDSGIDWIGQIPAHWEVRRLKHLSEIFRGKFTHRPRNDPRLYDGEYPFFQTGDVARAGMFLSEYRQTLNEAGLRVSTLIPKGTILITIAANIGDVTILDIAGCFPDSVVGFKPHPKIERDFLYYSMSAMKTIFMNNSIANAQANLNVERIGGITVCVPPQDEQNAIMEYVQTANEKTDSAIDVKQSQIATLKEYKTSLINAAVTGKIKVI